MDLTTLTRAKAALSAGVGSLGSDGMLQGLIASASDAASSWCARTFQRNAVSNLVLNGTGTARQMMPANPIISVTAPVIVDGYSFTLAPAITAGQQLNPLAGGYAYDRKFLYLLGGARFSRGFQNILVTQLTSGYTTSQADTIPVSPYTLTPRQGAGVDAWGQPMPTSGYAVTDRGVVNTLTGVAYTKVTSGPATGQYTFSEGVYTFAAANIGVGVTMSYDFIPASVEQAVIEVVGTKIRQTSNFGIRSRTIGNETVSYADVALSKSAQMLLQPYRWVITP